jgi:hypothetical protein
MAPPVVGWLAMASMSATMDAMPASARRRIHVTETPRLAAILQRNSMPGEARAATLARLAERADALAAEAEDFLVFQPDRPVLTTEEVTGLLDQDEIDRSADLDRG